MSLRKCHVGIPTVKATELIVLPKQRWDELVFQINRKRLDQETLERQEAYWSYVKASSAAMTSQWIDSLENKEKLKNLRRLEDKSKPRPEGHFNLRKEQAKERAAINEATQRQLLEKTAPTLALTRALYMSNVILENNRQRELKEKLRQHRMDTIKQDGLDLARQHEEETMKDAKKRSDTFMKAKAHEADLIKQFTEINTNKLNTHCQQLTESQQKTIQMQEDETNKKQWHQEDLVLRKKKALAELENRRDAVRRDQVEKKIQDEELTRIANAFNETRFKRNCQVKALTKKWRDDFMNNNQRMGISCSKESKASEVDENSRYLEQLAEKDGEYQSKMSEIAEFKKRLIVEKLEDLKKCMDERKKQDDDEAEMKRYEMMVRYKQKEVIKKVDDANARKEREKKLRYRQELLDQMKEKVELQALRKQLENIPGYPNQGIVDERFFAYAKNVLEEAKSRGWPTLPIDKVIYNYKKENHLLSPKPRPVYEQVKRRKHFGKRLNFAVANCDACLCPGKEEHSNA